MRSQAQAEKEVITLEKPFILILIIIRRLRTPKNVPTTFPSDTPHFSNEFFFFSQRKGCFTKGERLLFLHLKREREKKKERSWKNVKQKLFEGAPSPISPTQTLLYFSDVYQNDQYQGVAMISFLLFPLLHAHFDKAIHRGTFFCFSVCSDFTLFSVANVEVRRKKGQKVKMGTMTMRRWRIRTVPLSLKINA